MRLKTIKKRLNISYDSLNVMLKMQFYTKKNLIRNVLILINTFTMLALILVRLLK